MDGLEALLIHSTVPQGELLTQPAHASDIRKSLAAVDKSLARQRAQHDRLKLQYCLRNGVAPQRSASQSKNCCDGDNHPYFIRYVSY